MNVGDIYAVSPLRYFDEDEAVRIYNKVDFNQFANMFAFPGDVTEEKLKDVFNRVFIERSLPIRMAAVFHPSWEYNRVSVESVGDVSYLESDDEIFIPHPAFERFHDIGSFHFVIRECMSNNRKKKKDRKYELKQILCDAVGSFNVIDYTVLGYFLVDVAMYMKRWKIK